jgi:NADP-dependent 3-hydroxy acid dehydrogenase YdfG
MKLKDQVVIITGAALGLGEAMTIAFAREGANIVAVDIQDTKLKNVAKRASTYGTAVIPLLADMLSRNDIKRM